MSIEADHNEQFAFEPERCRRIAHLPSAGLHSAQIGHVFLNKTCPCKITDLSISKPGKHGHAKLSITGVDIFTAKKYEHVVLAHSTDEVPNVVKREPQLLDVSRDGFLSLFDIESGDIKDDIKTPQGEVGERVTKAMDVKQSVMVVVQVAMGEEAVFEAKEVKED